MPGRIVLSLLMAGGAFLCVADAFPQPRPLFTQHERQSRAAARPNPRCRPEPYETPITYSEVTVFDSREIVYQISTVVPCLGEVGDPPSALQWEAPSGTPVVFRSTLSKPEFEQFKIFLDRADVRGTQSFLNAGPGVGDFKIVVARPAGTQNIEVLSLSPDHFQLVDDPSLVHLICKAKEFARMASRSGERPEWCWNARPLVPAASAQAAIQDSQAISVAQRANVQELDRALRAKQSFTVWFAALVGKTAKVIWEVNDCGEATGSAADVGRDFPVCAEARAFLSQKREVVISVAVGTVQKGILTPPTLNQVILVEENGLIRDAKTLSGLARLLQK